MSIYQTDIIMISGYPHPDPRKRPSLLMIVEGDDMADPVLTRWYFVIISSFVQQGSKLSKNDLHVLIHNTVIARESLIISLLLIFDR